MMEGIVDGFDGDAEAGLPASRIERIELSDPRLAHLLRLPPGLAGLAVAQVVPALMERRRMPAPALALGRGQNGANLGPGTIATFADLLFDGSGSEGEDFAFDLFERTADPQFVAARLLDPAAAEIGLRWCSDTEDFLRVTYAASRLQRLFHRMVRECPPPLAERPGKMALLGPVPGEQHTFGLSIVEDALRRAGWQVDLCLPGEGDEMLRLAGDNHYRFVGLSLSSEHLLPALTRFAAGLRRRSRNPDIRVVAGGWLFREQPLLASEAGADHCCADAGAAVRLAESLLAPAPARCQMPVAAE